MIKIFSKSTDSESLGNLFRQKRFTFFKEKIDIIVKEKKISNTLPVSILDIGGELAYWINLGFQKKEDFNITLLNLSLEKTDYPNINAIVGNATNLNQFKDNAFDIVFSNSVIEHLYDYESQIKMSLEVVRVGQYHFIQTPNKYFFIEPHYLLPSFFQYFSPKLKFKILTQTLLSRGIKWDKKFAEQYIAEIRLISLKEMKMLFPQSKIYKEKFIGMIKSFTAHNFK